MTIERGEASAGGKAAKAGRFLGSLKDALMAASRDDAHQTPVEAASGMAEMKVIPLAVPVMTAAMPEHVYGQEVLPPSLPNLSAAEAARHARTIPAARLADRHIEAEDPPTTRVVRGSPPAAQPQRTQLVRGRQKITRGTFAQDPVVGFLVIVGGPGLGASRAIFEGNNTIGRTASNRIAFDFGDDSISADAQAYLRYDSTDRSFLFVPNLAKTNVVSVNDKRPSGAVELKSMDVITLGRTQVAFVPFCGPEFDWSEISETKDE
jgi:FHA domain